MSTMNRLANCHNQYQGTFKKVLCVCSAGLLRSPTAAFVLANEFDCNTRAAGLTTEFALIPVDDVLLEWADEVVCMEKAQAVSLRRLLEFQSLQTPVVCLNIPDDFSYRNPELIALIRAAYKGHLEHSKQDSAA
jgi:predicted protein tyrosine phosphatase